MGFSTLANLQSQLTTLKNNLSSYNSQLSVQKKRKSKIEAILWNMKSVCINSGEYVNDHIKGILADIQDALKGTTSAPTILSIVKGDKEKDISNDGNMSEALNQLNSELADVNNKISDLEQNISSTNTQITNCMSSIASEQHSIARGYETQYDNARYELSAAGDAYKQEPSSARLRRAYNSALRVKEQARINYNKYKGWL